MASRRNFSSQALRLLYSWLLVLCPPIFHFPKNFRFMDSLALLVFADRADWQCDSYSLSCPLGITKDHTV